jgi:hypothetical protein
MRGRLSLRSLRGIDAWLYTLCLVFIVGTFGATDAAAQATSSSDPPPLKVEELEQLTTL